MVAVAASTIAAPQNCKGVMVSPSIKNASSALVAGASPRFRSDQIRAPGSGVMGDRKCQPQERCPPTHQGCPGGYRKTPTTIHHRRTTRDGSMLQNDALQARR